MFLLKYSKQFKKDLKHYKNNSGALQELEVVLDFLAKGAKLPEKYLNHRLQGEFRGCFECHIKPDILLLYTIEQSAVIVLLLRIGSHPTLF
jgi:mRNA interferase YafQ